MNSPSFVLGFAEESSDSSTSMDAYSGDDVARSERNILHWMTYLPEHCVRTMIRMGWDVTT